MSNRKFTAEDKPEISEQLTQSQTNHRDKVGYKNPPKNTQFRKGMSGNPKGRPKRKLSGAESFHEVFDKKIMATVDGKKVYLDGREALFLNLRSKTSKGDLPAMRIFVNFCKLYGIKDPYAPNEQLKGLFDALMAGPVEGTPKYKDIKRPN